MTSTEQKQAGKGKANKGHDESNSRPIPIVAKVDGQDTSSGEVPVTVPAPYRDYSQVAPEKTAFQRNSKEPAQTFPMKLHEILTNPEFEDIISWLPHGRAWRIVRHKAFEERVIPLYFRHGRYSSFARQVNGWGFRRITHGTDYNSYYHEMFLRGLPYLCEKMKRLGSKDEARVKNEDAPTPDFYALSRDHPLPDSGITTQTYNQGALAVGLPTSVGPIIGQRQVYTTGHPSSSLGASSNPAAIQDLSKMSLDDLERQRAEIIRQMQMQLSTSSAAPVSVASATYLSRQDLAGGGMAILPAGAPISAHNAAPTPYTTSSTVAGTGWNAPTSSMPALSAGGGGGSQAALYQALISQLASGTSNPSAPAPPPPPPPPLPPQQYGAGSSQSILEALLGGGGNGGLAQLLSGGGGTEANLGGGGNGGLAQLLSGGGGAEANSSNGALGLAQLLSGGGGTDATSSNGGLGLAQLLSGGGGTDSTSSTGGLRLAQLLSGSGGTDANSLAQLLSGGSGTDANSSALLQLQRQLQQTQQFQSMAAPRNGNEIRATVTANFQKPYEQPTSQKQGNTNDTAASIQRQLQLALSGQQGGNELAISGQQGGSDFRSLYQQGSTASHQRGGEDDLLAAIQRQLQQATAFPQQELQQQQLPQLQQQPQQQQPQQLREQGMNDNDASLRVSYQMPPPNRQHASDSDAMTNLQRQLQLAASQQNDPTASIHQLQLFASQLSGQSNTGGSGGGGGNPNIAELAAILGLPGVSRQNDSSS